LLAAAFFPHFIDRTQGCKLLARNDFNGMPAARRLAAQAAHGHTTAGECDLDRQLEAQRGIGARLPLSVVVFGHDNTCFKQVFVVPSESPDGEVGCGVGGRLRRHGVPADAV
jgi:hypothetical protein